MRDAPGVGAAQPLVVFSHGFGGHRRQSTFVTTHLASHGYVVVAPDHAGTTLPDLMQVGTSARSALEIRAATALLEEATRARPLDVAKVLAAARGFTSPGIDPERVAVAGHSLGGWTALAAIAREPAIRAVFLLAPAGGRSGVADDPLPRALDLGWTRVVPTLTVAAARDSILPLHGVRELHARIPGPRRLVVLEDADHFHFCDRADRLHELMRRMNPAMPPIGDLAGGERTEPVVRALALAHCDAGLRGDPSASRWLAQDIPGLLARLELRGSVYTT